MVTEKDIEQFSEQCKNIFAQVARDVIGQKEVVEGTIIAMIAGGTAKKGDVIGTARLAAIMASKKTAELIPLCHPIALTRVAVDFELDEAASAVHCTAVCETYGKTGVEMEALTAVEIGLLTIYDMCKAVDRFMEIGGVKLLEKDGGKSGHWIAPN